MKTCLILILAVFICLNSIAQSIIHDSDKYRIDYLDSEFNPIKQVTIEQKFRMFYDSFKEGNTNAMIIDIYSTTDKAETIALNLYEMEFDKENNCTIFYAKEIGMDSNSIYYTSGEPVIILCTNTHIMITFVKVTLVIKDFLTKIDYGK